MYTVVASLSYIPPKCGKTREPKDGHCVSWCAYINYLICNPVPLDNPKNHIALLYITVSHKLTQDKTVVTDFRHLNVRIAKNNLAYPLVRNTFSVLGNSKCKVLSVLDLKDAFNLLRLSEEVKKYCSILPYFGHASYIYQRMSITFYSYKESAYGKIRRFIKSSIKEWA